MTVWFLHLMLILHSNAAWGRKAITPGEVTDNKLGENKTVRLREQNKKMIIPPSIFSLLPAQVVFNCVPTAMILSSGPRWINTLAPNRRFICNSSISSQRRANTRCSTSTMFLQGKNIYRWHEKQSGEKHRRWVTTFLGFPLTMIRHRLDECLEISFLSKTMS